MIVQCVKHGTTFEVVLGSSGCQPCLSEELEKDQNDAIERINKIPPVDRDVRVLTDGSPVTDDHREIINGGSRDGQQKGYVVLSDAERAKGFVRPYRDTYLHNTCRTTTTMGRAIAETYARDPGFYSGTFCVNCKQHFPLDQFVWSGTTEQVGS